MGVVFKVDETYFDSWSPTMAYTLGYIVADGNMVYSPKTRGHYVKITSTDIERLEFFKQCLHSEHRIFRQPSNGKPLFVLRIGSHGLFASLAKRGLTPNKSLTLLLPKVPRRYRSHFVRGLFDGDGCVYVERTHGSRGQVIDKALRTIFTSGSKSFLQQFNELVRTETGITRTILCSRTAFQVRYGTADSIRLFEFMYKDVPLGGCMPRKCNLFKQYFIRRQDQISKEVQSILEYLDGHVAK